MIGISQWWDIIGLVACNYFEKSSELCFLCIENSTEPLVVLIGDNFALQESYWELEDKCTWRAEESSAWKFRCDDYVSSSFIRFPSKAMLRNTCKSSFMSSWANVIERPFQKPCIQKKYENYNYTEWMEEFLEDRVVIIYFLGCMLFNRLFFVREFDEINIIVLTLALI